MMIRGLKKAIKVAIRHPTVVPKSGLLRMTEGSVQTEERWQEFVRVVGGMEEFVEEYARTEIGGKSTETGGFSSFNKRFVRHFYESPYVRVAHFYFSEWLFSGEPRLLCLALKLSCCDGEHSSSCLHKWQALKHYVTSTVLTEVNLLPFTLTNSDLSI